MLLKETPIIYPVLDRRADRIDARSRRAQSDLDRTALPAKRLPQLRAADAGVTGFILKRLGFALITLWILSVIVFFVGQILPGDPGRSILGSPRGAAGGRKPRPPTRGSTGR